MVDPRVEARTIRIASKCLGLIMCRYQTDFRRQGHPAMRPVTMLERDRLLAEMFRQRKAAPAPWPASLRSLVLSWIRGLAGIDSRRIGPARASTFATLNAARRLSRAAERPAWVDETGWHAARVAVARSENVPGADLDAIEEAERDGIRWPLIAHALREAPPVTRRDIALVIAFARAIASGESSEARILSDWVRQKWGDDHLVSLLVACAASDALLRVQAVLSALDQPAEGGG